MFPDQLYIDAPAGTCQLLGRRRLCVRVAQRGSVDLIVGLRVGL